MLRHKDVLSLLRYPYVFKMSDIRIDKKKETSMERRVRLDSAAS